jgi:hypothetical protein
MDEDDWNWVLVDERRARSAPPALERIASEDSFASRAERRGVLRAIVGGHRFESLPEVMRGDAEVASCSAVSCLLSLAVLLSAR